MSEPLIKIDQVPLGPGVPKESRDDLVVGTPVTLTDTANGAGAYLWKLVVPPTSSATLSGETTDTAMFTPDVPGTYLVYLTFNVTDKSFTLDSNGNKVSVQGGAGVKHRLGTRPLGTGEIFQYHPSAGFAESFYSYFGVIDAVTRTVNAPLGTLFYSDAQGDLERLAPGAAGQYLLSNGIAAPSWGAISVSHGSLSGLTIPGDHPQYLLVDGTRNVTGVMAFNAGLSIGGNTASDILLSSDSASSSNLALITAGYLSTYLTEAGIPLIGPGGYVQKKLNEFYDGSLLDEADINVTSDGATVTFSIQKDGGGDIHLRISEQTYFFDTTPAATIALTTGTDATPQTNYVYLTESGGTVTLGTSTSGWPVVEYSALAIVYCQSAVSLQADGPLKVHAYTDHLHNSHQGHLAEMNRWIRLQQATWFSGVAPADMTFSSPDAYLSVSAGTVYQLHEHTFPARDMSLGDPAWLVNDPTTTYKRITTFDDITQLADGGIVENKWFSLVLWASVNQDDADCKLFINLPSGSYNSQSQAEDDSNGYNVFAIPQEFKGTGFLIAKYTVKGKNSGLWEQGSRVDLRGQFPISSPGASGGTTDHGNLSGLTDVADHPGYLTLDGTRTMTGDLLSGTNKTLDIGTLATRWKTGFVQGLDIEYSAIGTAEIAGILLNNDTLAAAGAQQHSPMLVHGGSGWKTDAVAGPQSALFAQQLRTIEGAANPTSELVFKSNINGAGYSDVFSMQSNGDATIGPNSADARLRFGTGHANNFIRGLTNAFTINAVDGQLAIFGRGYLRVTAVASTAVSPTIMITDPSAGIFRPVPSEFAISTALTEAVRWDALQNQINAGDITIPNGSKVILDSAGDIHIAAVGPNWFTVRIAGADKLLVGSSQVQLVSALLRSNVDKGYSVGVEAARWSTFYGQNADLEYSAIGTAATEGLRIANDTLAAAGVQQYSPAIGLHASGWKTDAVAGPVETFVTQQVHAIEGAVNPSVELVFQATITGFDTVRDLLTLSYDGSAGGRQAAFPEGTATNPGLSFFNYRTSGIRAAGADDLRMVMSSITRHKWTSSYLITASGSAAVPAFQIVDPSTGLFRPTLNHIAVTTAGTMAVYWDSAQNQVNAGDISLGNTQTLWLDDDEDSGFVATSDDNVIFYIGGGNRHVYTSVSQTSYVPLSLTKNTLGTTDSVMLELKNLSAAAAGAQQHSSMIVQTGAGWKTDATAGSQRVSFAQQVIPVQGTSAPTGELTFRSNINLVGWVDQFKISSTGDVTATGDLDAAGGFRRTLQVMGMDTLSASTTYTLILSGYTGHTSEWGWMVAPRAGSVVEMTVHALGLSGGTVDFWVQKSIDDGTTWSDVWGSSGSPVLSLVSGGTDTVAFVSQAKDISGFAAGDVLRIQAATNVSFIGPNAIFASIGVEC